ncbi:MAG: lipase family protein [Pseudomonadota bacterium]
MPDRSGALMDGIKSLQGRIGAIARSVLVAIAMSSSVSVAAAQSPDINFRLLYDVARLANQAYDGTSEIFGRLSADKATAVTPGTSQVQYVLNFNDARRIQVISVRGTDNDANVELDLDTKGVLDRKSGIFMHNGFRTAARDIYADLKPRLKPGYTTYLTGHSLGGAVAAILGIYLTVDGYKVGRIATFGQPKFTDIAGARAYWNLPLLRLIYQNDTVVFLPDTFAGSKRKYAHIGAVVNLLSGPYYVYGSAAQGMEFSVGSFGRLFGQISVPDHSMKWYLQGLREKVDGATEVGFEDRNRYIIRHRRGSGAGTQPAAKPKYNFNHHN